MKKKTYEQPQISIIEVKAADIICTSGTGTFSLSEDGTLEQGLDSDWGDDLDW